MEAIDCNLLCVGCGYNLKHARTDGRCSECGVEVVRSINGDQLYRAEKRWLKKLAFGMRLMLNAAILLVVAILTSIFQLPAKVEEWWNLLGGSGFVLLEGVGMWMVMSVEKNVTIWIRLLRASILFFMISVLAEMGWSIGAILGKNWPRIQWIEGASQYGLAAMLITMMGVFLRGREIARRAFAPSMRWQCGVLALLQVILAPAAILEFTMMNARSRTIEQIAYLTELIMQGGLVLTFTWGTIVIWMIRRCVIRATKLSGSVDAAASAAAPQG